MTLKDLIDKIPLEVFANSGDRDVEIHIFENGRCFDAEFVILEEVKPGNWVIDLRKGERVE